MWAMILRPSPSGAVASPRTYRIGVATGVTSALVLLHHLRRQQQLSRRWGEVRGHRQEPRVALAVADPPRLAVLTVRDRDRVEVALAAVQPEHSPVPRVLN